MRKGLLTILQLEVNCLPPSLRPSFLVLPVSWALSQPPPLTWTDGLCGTQPPTPKQATPLPTVSFCSQLPLPVCRGGRHFPVFF